MSSENSEIQKALLVRVAYVCSRGYMSRERHFKATEEYKRLRQRLGTVLIVSTSLTAVGLLSILSPDTMSTLIQNTVLRNRIVFGAKLTATFLSFLNLAIAGILTYLGLEEKIVRHEQSGHSYTKIRDEAINLAERISFRYNDSLSAEIQGLEDKCNLIGESSPRVPLKIHEHLVKREKKKGTADARYWFHRFWYPNEFADHFTMEARHRGFADRISERSQSNQED